MKTALETNKTTHASQYAHEDEHFWRKHLVAFPRSGLTKAAYCRENAINYNRFFYRINNIASLRSIMTPTI
ncbi:MAG: hypothetical protein A3E82_01725 [Gammaproteobacteria bacterium RIFCSPHIGHO2_12_FULL_38_11]|nr:MAG: hypothetical protein A3E82_01725 [Gammaproteobacteria bacterium RIFCSPHIGHO2_12_FULL_38_11]